LESKQEIKKKKKKLTIHSPKGNPWLVGEKKHRLPSPLPTHAESHNHRKSEKGNNSQKEV